MASAFKSQAIVSQLIAGSRFRAYHEALSVGIPVRRKSLELFRHAAPVQKRRAYASAKASFQSALERLTRIVRKSGWLDRAVLGAVPATLCLAFPTGSQQPAEGIVIAGQRFEIGVPKDAALTKLADCCNLSGSGDSFVIFAKQPHLGSGSVSFADGKVVSLSLNDGQYKDQESVSLAQTLYELFAEHSYSEKKRGTLQVGGDEIRGNTTVVEGEPMLLSIEEIESGNMTLRTFSLRFRNGRSVVMRINKLDANPKAAVQIPDWVDVWEEFGQAIIARKP